MQFYLNSQLCGLKGKRNEKEERKEGRKGGRKSEKAGGEEARERGKENRDQFLKRVFARFLLADKWPSFPLWSLVHLRCLLGWGGVKSPHPRVPKCVYAQTTI